MSQPPDPLLIAQRVLSAESAALDAAKARFGTDAAFARAWTEAVDTIIHCRGRVVVTGLGKSGAVGRKIASTLASTGTPALWMHAGEALHGDLGMVTRGDCVLAISYSGRTEEILRLLPTFEALEVLVIAFTAQRQSPLGARARCTVETVVEREACPLNLAPTTSTTLCLALGDALAVCLMEKRGFDSSDFLRFHPGGAIGHGLTLSVAEVMRTGERVALCREDASLRAALGAISLAVAGAVLVVDEYKRLSGYLTDGDVRRALLYAEDAGALLDTPVSQLMTRSPLSLRGEMSAREALRLFAERRINDAPVVDEAQQPVGWLEESDLLRAGVG